MTGQAKVMLCFQTGEPAGISLALQYWALSSEGQWSVTVKEIADRLPTAQGEARVGRCGATVPLGEAGRNELRIAADEEAHLLLCAQTDDGGARPG
jgi:hypothetical protein